MSSFSYLNLTLALALCLATPMKAEPRPVRVVNPYGVCQSIMRWIPNQEVLEKYLMAMKFAGIGYVRADIDSYTILREDGTYDFSRCDSVVDELKKNGIEVLPIIFGKAKEEKPPVDLAEYREYVKAVVGHYGSRFPVWEVWNEANYKFEPNAYAEMLKVAYEAIKSVDPSIRVAYTGPSLGYLHWVRKTFEAGAAKCFDVMNLHPYTQPRGPEQIIRKLGELRQLMDEFGIGDRPIWFTEVGWSTHEQLFNCPSILRAGLKVARPDQRIWNVILIDNALSGIPDQRIARQVLALLPAGSRAVALNQREALSRLAAHDVDVVMYPVDETFPAETVEAVNRFVAEGGVFVDFGGMPCYYGRLGDEDAEGLQNGEALVRFPFGAFGSWSRQDIPGNPEMAVTAAGLAAGVIRKPGGYRSKLFLCPERAGEHEWIPLVASVLSNDVEVCGAAVIKYRSERKGAAILSTVREDRDWCSWTNTEQEQAEMTARALAIAMAEKIEAYFHYCLKSTGTDPYYSECHFGLLQDGFQPKPAYSAFMQFVRARPVGSANIEVAWHDGRRRLFYPQWKRPDGLVGGMVWKTDGAECREIAFAGKVDFHDLYGRKILPRHLGGNRYRIELSTSPVYFTGAELNQQRR